MLSGPAGLLLLALVGADPPDADRTVPVLGIVHDRDNQEPLAGVVVVLSNGRGTARVESDGRGRLEARVEPGILTGQVVEVPAGYVRPLRAFQRPVEVPAGAETVDLPPIELLRGRTVRGTVVDEQGRAVPGAEVQAFAYVFEPWLDGVVVGPKVASTAADDQGAFVLSGLDPLPSPRSTMWLPRLAASSADAVSPSLTAIPAEGEGPVTLRIERAQAVKPPGKVLDTASRPVSGAVVEIWTQWRTETGFVLGAPLLFDGRRELHANADGSFEVPAPLSRGIEYCAVARADGFLPSRTAWVQPSSDEGAAFPELRLPRLRTVSGRVVDRHGGPIAGARVFQSGDGAERTETVSDEQGRFALAGAAEGLAFVFAQHPDYRFQGRMIEPGADAVDLMLTQTNEPAQALPARAAAPLPPDEELEIARLVMRPYLDRALQRDDQQARWDAMFHWALIDPGDALARLDDGALPAAGADSRDFLRGWIARGLIRRDADEAAAVAESIDDNDRRVRAYIDLAGAVGVLPPGRKRQFLDEAFQHARATTEASLRAIWLHCVADGLLDLDDAASARPVLDEARQIAGTLSGAGNNGNARAYVAQVLARVDLPAALELARTLEDDRTFDRCHGTIAYQVAAQHPAEAERVLGMVQDPYHRDESAVKVCYRMAAADPERARAVARRIVNPYSRAHALGLIARACSATDKKRALASLDEAFAGLQRIAAGGEERLAGTQSTAAIAGVHVATAAMIDPQLVPEYFWRALALRRPHVAAPRDEDDVQESNARLAMTLAHFDSSLARRLLEPVIDHAVRCTWLNSSRCGLRAIDAAAAIDPRWAAEVVERFPENAWGKGRRQRDSARTTLVWVLAHRLEARIRTSTNVWLPGGPGNAFAEDF